MTIIDFTYMGSFAQVEHYFAAVSEKDDFVITAINFMLNQSFSFCFYAINLPFKPSGFVRSFSIDLKIEIGRCAMI